MINKETYKRLTEETVGCFRYCLKDHKSKYGEFNNYDAFFDYSAAIMRLGILEDKIMDGTIIEIDESLIGQGIIGIHHFTDGTYQLDLDENIVIGFSSDGVITWNGTHHYNDEFRNGMFFMDNEKGKTEAQARLKEYQEEKINEKHAD